MLERLRKIQFDKIDYVILFCMSVLISVGLYCIYQSDHNKPKVSGLFQNQLLGVLLGAVVVLILLFVDYHFVIKFTWIYYIGIVGLLAYTLRCKPINHVRRWITLGGIQFQTSELAKVIMILVLAYLCNKLKPKMNKFYTFFILAGVTAIPVLLILKEPHLSSTLAFAFIFCIILFAAGLSYKVIITIGIIGILSLGSLVFCVTKLKVEIPFIKGYMIGRVETFFAPDDEVNEDAKYQTNKAVIAIHSGGAYGKMLDPREKGTTRRYGKIYANESDFVFSIVGEEFGFVGSSIILLFYLILILRCLGIARRAPDDLGKLICIGVTALLMFQTFVNIGVASDILPNTGLPLPFISYGLTSLVSSMVAVGFVLNVGLRTKGREYQ